MARPAARSRTGSRADPGTSVLVLEAGRSDYGSTRSSTCPRRYRFPIGNRLYDWKYETDPEPHMNGRRIVHARGKVLGGSSSINGMIFQRGNPLDYERWATEPGMERWDYLHCLPYFKKMETCCSRPRRRRLARRRRARWCLERGPATNPLFGAFFEAAQQAGHPLTDDVNGYRQEGFARFDRNVHRGRRLVRRPRLPAPGAAPQNLQVETLALATGSGLDGPRAVGRRLPARRPRPTVASSAGEVILLRWRDQLPAAAAALRASATRRSSGSSAIDAGPPTCPASGENLQDHLEVYIQYASTQPVSIAPGLRWRHAPRIGYDWLFQPPRPRRDQPLRGRRLRPQQRGRRLPEPDVPLPADRDPLRRLGAGRGHGYQVHIGPMYADTRGWVDPKSRDPVRAPLDAVQLPVDRQRPARVGRGGAWPRDILNQPAFAAFNGGELSPGPRSRPTRRSSTGCAEDAETALHPSCTAKMGVDESRSSTRPRCGSTGVDGLRVVDASVSPSSPTATSTPP